MGRAGCWARRLPRHSSVAAIESEQVAIAVAVEHTMQQVPRTKYVGYASIISS